MGCFKTLVRKKRDTNSSRFPHQEYLRECMDQIEVLMHASLPPSPASSLRDEPDKVSEPRPRSSSEGPAMRGRRLFATSAAADHTTSTPTKVLDVARDCWKARAFHSPKRHCWSTIKRSSLQIMCKFILIKPWSSLVEEDEDIGPNLVIVLNELSQLLWHLINTLDTKSNLVFCSCRVNKLELLHFVYILQQ